MTGNRDFADILIEKIIEQSHPAPTYKDSRDSAPAFLSFLMGAIPRQDPEASASPSPATKATGTLQRAYGNSCARGPSVRPSVRPPAENSLKSLPSFATEPKVASVRPSGPPHALNLAQRRAFDYLNNLVSSCECVLHADFTATELKVIYRMLALRHHPDHNPHAPARTFIEIKAAIEELGQSLNSKSKK
jgi:hypothetical protein